MEEGQQQEEQEQEELVVEKWQEEAVGETEEELMLLAAQHPCAHCFGFPIAAGLPWTLAVLEAAAEHPLFLAYPLKPAPLFAPAYD